MSPPRLSVVVACYRMARELPRTLQSLASDYQTGVTREDYEVIVVDNGSPEPPRIEELAHLALDLQIQTCDSGSPSPARALNQGLAAATSDLIGVMIDGARMASPGLLSAAMAAARLHPRAIIFTQGLMLGHEPQWLAAETGYNQTIEDALLRSIDWPSDGYRLFDIACWAGAPADETRWFTPGFESNALFMPRALWDEVGGYDEAFQAPGGGLLSTDLFASACSLPDTQLVVIAGEATFHQFHAESATTANADALNQIKRFFKEYAGVRRRIPRAVSKPYWLFQVAPPPLPAPAPPALAQSYVSLLKSLILNEGAVEIEARLIAQQKLSETRPSQAELSQARQRVQRQAKIGIRSYVPPPGVLSMIGEKRLEHLQTCVEAVIAEGVPGDLVECGVWRGGAAMLMAGILKARGNRDRTVWLADSFAGLPPIEPGLDPPVDVESMNADGLAVPVAEVRANFERYGLLDDRIRFLEGWFADTLPSAPIAKIAVLRVDGDFYHSTMDALTHLYAKVSPGGFVIIDDYGCVPSCAQAVREFRSRHGIEAPISEIDWTGVYWRKEA